MQLPALFMFFPKKFDFLCEKLYFYLSFWILCEQVGDCFCERFKNFWIEEKIWSNDQVQRSRIETEQILVVVAPSQANYINLNKKKSLFVNQDFFQCWYLQGCFFYCPRLYFNVIPSMLHFTVGILLSDTSGNWMVEWCPIAECHSVTGTIRLPD